MTARELRAMATLSRVGLRNRDGSIRSEMVRASQAGAAKAVIEMALQSLESSSKYGQADAIRLLSAQLAEMRMTNEEYVASKERLADEYDAKAAEIEAQGRAA